MLRTSILTSLIVLGLVALSGAAEASPIDKVSDKAAYTVQWACDNTQYTCIVKMRDIPDPFDPCTCPPIE